MKTYAAQATRDGKWWAVQVKGLPDNYVTFTQGATWTEAQEMAEDLVHTVHEDAGIDEPFTVELRPGDPDVVDALDELDVARQKQLAADAEEDRALAAAARTLTRRGFTVRDAARVLGISYQRVSQLAPKSAKSRRSAGTSTGHRSIKQPS
ncbi:type II toxin-antitoxin system HicB family antitoxin [Streptomyces sp. B-S-A8]|uniref:Type II toxin-antitoxin system HicB family antitoxin n=1 Tax=Streptomyces solicavernae TaxID=3043614 RepID=A0ABT6RRM2_9ACTN|nr:type II toxin-antitoxin system HicB family antitoxin [Streptomyces sp. B-S-A8]MDI3387092.1 type II toxin-antitoxin system HicB family antitoxin [Streptomyces sp. B-S-A8]